MASLCFRTSFNVNLKPCLGSRALPPSPIPICFSSSSIECGLRSSRKQLWRSNVLSKEAIQAVQALKLAKSTEKLQEVLTARRTRLLKANVLAALAELQRQNEFDLSLEVFNFISEEVGNETLLLLYCDMILLLGRNKKIEMAQELFSEMTRKGLKPDTRTYTEMIGAYIQVNMTDTAMEIYELMKTSGRASDKLTFAILIRQLEKVGEQELLATLKEECDHYVDSPGKFLQHVEQKHAEQRDVNSV